MTSMAALQGYYAHADEAADRGHLSGARLGPSHGTPIHIVYADAAAVVGVVVAGIEDLLAAGPAVEFVLLPNVGHIIKPLAIRQTPTSTSIIVEIYSAMTAALLESLQQIVGTAGLLTGSDVTSRNAGFFRDDQLKATILVRPKSTEEVSAVLKLCHEIGQPVVPQGGRTGLVHGSDATSQQVILSLERLNVIEQIDPVQRIAVVQAGVTLQALQEAASDNGLFFPLDLGARGTATLGGNLATNAGGNRVIRYGMARDSVLGLEAVLADGTVVSSLNRMIKNNAGYDLKQLFVGTEGTLGVITRAVFRLREHSRSHNVALVAVDRFEQIIALLKCVDRELGGTLSAFEVMWQSFYQLVTTAPATSQAPLGGDYPYYILVEAQGGAPERDAVYFQEILEQALNDGVIVDAAIANSDRERAAIWGLRDDVLQTKRYGAVFMFDVSLPLADMQTYVESVETSLRAIWPNVHLWTFGHLGDGNLHFAVSPPEANPQSRAQVEHAIYSPLAGVGGSISAEHGIGEEKKRYLGISRSNEEIALMHLIKQALDPKGILNPGKVI